MATTALSSLLSSAFHLGPPVSLSPRPYFKLPASSSPPPTALTTKAASHSTPGPNSHVTGPSPPPPPSPALLDRREVMAASVASLSLLTSSSPSTAAPITTPNLSDCKLATVTPPPVVTGVPSMQVQCCLPTTPSLAVAYRVEKKPPLKRRAAAHKVDAAYIAKCNRAYQLMKALPPTDPRSFKVQSDMHCAFCNGAYTQRGSKADLEVHFSWIFLPWHRWYLYFHERILGSLIGDPNFALVYWNWDDQEEGGNLMPPMFLPQDTALYDAKRNQAHLPPSIISLNLGSTATKPQDIIQENLNEMYQTMVTATTPKLFMGGEYRAGDVVDQNAGVPGTLEAGPHNAVHAWTGDNRQTYGEDMGNFYSAARDPIFFAHHSNVDRLWTVWKRIGGSRKKRRDFRDADFLDATFLFYDERARLVTVRARDALHSEKLGVVYEPAKTDKQWLNFQPQPVTAGAVEGDSGIEEVGAASREKGSREIKGRRLVSRVQRVQGKGGVEEEETAEEEEEEEEEGEQEEVLVVEGLEFPTAALFQVAVFVNLPDADERTATGIAEYVGSFSNVPHFGMAMARRRINVRLPISDNLARIGIADPSAPLIVTILVRGTKTEVPISLAGLKIELE